jgi:Domain of unknown function (DUF4359)
MTNQHYPSNSILKKILSIKLEDLVIKGLPYITGFGVISTAFLCITNPDLATYEAHEMQRFKGQGQQISYKAAHCSNKGREEMKNGWKLSQEYYQPLCEQIVSEFENKPERLLAMVRGNTKRDNMFIYSVYNTHYAQIENEIDQAIKSHPTYRDRSTYGEGVTTSRGSGGSGSSTEAVGIFGTFLENRIWY